MPAPPFPKVSKPLIAPAALFEARLDKLEKEIGALKGQVARLCTAYGKLAKTTKNIRKAPISAFSVTGSKVSLGYSNGSGDKNFVFVATDQESVVMQPVKLSDCP